MVEPATNFAQRRVLIIENDTLVGMGIRALLERLGHLVVGQASKPAEALEVYRESQPDVVLLEIRLDGVDGIELAKQLLKERPCPMIIVSALTDKNLIDRASAAGVFGYLIKPVTADALQAQIEISISRFHEHQLLLQEKAQLTRALEDRKLIERAKGIFMRRLNLSEPEAHRRLQQESQKRRIGLAELAKRIIESEELLGGAENNPGGPSAN